MPPGTGWPGDPATAATPVADGAGRGARAGRGRPGRLAELAARQSVCRACPRLVAWREQVAAEKRRSFRGRAVLGPPGPRLGIGRAADADRGPGAGRARRQPDRADLHRRPQRRRAVRLAVADRAGRPADQRRRPGTGSGCWARGWRRRCGARRRQNKPTMAERDTCAPWLAAELALVAGDLRVVVCLGPFRLAGDVAAAGRGRVRGAQAPAGVRSRRRGHGGRPGPAPRRCWSSAAITRASRTPSPGG